MSGGTARSRGSRFLSERSMNRRALVRSGATVAMAAVLAPAIGARRAFAQTTPTSGKKVTVTVNNAPAENQPAALKTYNEVIKRFEQMHPNITIKADSNSWDPKTFPAQLAAGTLDDAFLVPFTEPQGIIARGQAADITEYLKKWPNFASFNPGILQIVQDAKGQIFGIPVAGYALGLLYNRTFFQKAGLDPDKPPTTWDELRDAAKKLTSGGRAGFVETSKDNQGGWHFTAWMYSAGGDLESVQNGKTTAVFSNPTGVEVLNFLKEMRWTDNSMGARQLLNQDDTQQMMATGQAAMSIQAGDSLSNIKQKFEDVNMDDLGMGILPQHGGNATLTGGSTWMFNPKSSPDVLAAAVEWTLYHEFDLQNYEDSLKADKAGGILIGWPQLPIFEGDFQQKRQALTNKYANAPVNNYKPYQDGMAGIKLRPEPPTDTQDMYKALDTAVQSILTNKGADPKKALDQAQQQFQKVLNQGS